MMHGREKSDSAIVAVKPTNKAVPTAAEPVEPRAGPRGMRLSQVRAARWLGISGRTSQAYALGERPIPHVVALCIRHHLKHGWYACQWDFRPPGWQVPQR
jgi:hypothetical protein